MHLTPEAPVWLCYTHVPREPRRLHPPPASSLRTLGGGADYVLFQGDRRAAEDWADDTLCTPPRPAQAGMYLGGEQVVFIDAQGQPVRSARAVLASLGERLSCEREARVRLQCSGREYR